MSIGYFVSFNVMPAQYTVSGGVANSGAGVALVVYSPPGLAQVGASRVVHIAVDYTGIHRIIKAPVLLLLRRGGTVENVRLRVFEYGGGHKGFKC